jgi:hypothetical protein
MASDNFGILYMSSYCSIHNCQQWYFCDETCWNAIPEVLSQENTNCNSVPEPFFSGIGITDTTTLRPNFGSLCVPEPFSKENSTACR